MSKAGITVTTSRSKLTFALTPEQCDRISMWSKEQDQLYVEKQRLEPNRDAFVRALNDEGIPYYGASGGELTFEFTPTGIGTVERVTHSGTKAVLDVTDYDSW